MTANIYRYQLQFASARIGLSCSSDESLIQLLRLLFPHSILNVFDHETYSVDITLSSYNGSKYTVRLGNEHVVTTNDIVHCAQHLYDQVIKLWTLQLTNGPVLHAAGIKHQSGNVIILPGEQGAGKSTATLWATANGYKVLSDELIYIDTQQKIIHGFPRPFMIKAGSAPFIGRYAAIDNTNSLLNNGRVYVLPINYTNSDYCFEQPLNQYVNVNFLQYKPDASLVTKSLGNSAHSLELIKNCVNASLDHERTMDQISRMVNECSGAFFSSFSTFEDLEQIFSLSNQNRSNYNVR